MATHWHNIGLTRTALAIFALALCCCKQPEPSYAPPEQHKPPVVRAPNPVMMLDMGDADIDDHIVKDVHPKGDTPWRWTAQEPTLKLVPAATDHVKLSVDFSIWDDGFKTTGPIQATYLVNGHELDKVRYTTPGTKHFEKSVPDGWLPPNAVSTIGLALDKVYVSPKDGFKAGIILSRIGFVR